MNITVVGLWHLGCVTAACCAEHFQVVGLDFDSNTIDSLRKGKAPVMEPGLDILLAEGLQSGRLRFDEAPELACANADILWICYDTPVNADDEADTELVMERIRRCAPWLPDGAVMIVSSQMPVGTCRLLEQEFPRLQIACAPENLRLGKALSVFRTPDRIILGARDEAARARMEPLFSRWSSNLVWMSPESAEMTKHGINSFLALSITFMNELARICELTGADAQEVESGLKSESRIGPGAYLRAGGAFAGGTLARDVVTLTRVAKIKNEPLLLIPSIKTSNDQHKLWALRRLQSELGPLTGKNIAVLGLTYKPGTDTLRRSLAVELCHALAKEGAKVQAFDPEIQTQPDEIGEARIHPDMASALKGTDAAVICTEWPQIRNADWPTLVLTMRKPLVLDANRFVGTVEGARCLSVGTQS